MQWKWTALQSTQTVFVIKETTITITVDCLLTETKLLSSSPLRDPYTHQRPGSALAASTGFCSRASNRHQPRPTQLNLTAIHAFGVSSSSCALACCWPDSSLWPLLPRACLLWDPATTEVYVDSQGPHSWLCPVFGPISIDWPSPFYSPIAGPPS